MIVVYIMNSSPRPIPLDLFVVVGVVVVVKCCVWFDSLFGVYPAVVFRYVN